MPPPRVGEHTEQVLSEAGYSMEDIELLQEKGAIDNAKYAEQAVQVPTSWAKRRPDEDFGPYTGVTWDRVRSVSMPLDGRAGEDDELSQVVKAKTEKDHIATLLAEAEGDDTGISQSGTKPSAK